jgi:hypothetical protein
MSISLFNHSRSTMGDWQLDAWTTARSYQSAAAMGIVLELEYNGAVEAGCPQPGVVIELIREERQKKVSEVTLQPVFSKIDSKEHAWQSIIEDVFEERNLAGAKAPLRVEGEYLIHITVQIESGPRLYIGDIPVRIESLLQPE